MSDMRMFLDLIGFVVLILVGAPIYVWVLEWKQRKRIRVNPLTGERL